MTVAKFFQKHPRAAKLAVGMAGQGASIGRILCRLREAHKYPFTGKTALRKWLAGREIPTSPSIQVGDVAGASAWIVTFAEAGEPLVQPALRALQQACDFHGARLLVYDNSQRTRFLPELEPYRCLEPMQLHRRVRVAGSHMSMTVQNPLPSSLYSRMGEACAIFGHPQHAFRSAPRHPSAPPRFLATTGAITAPPVSRNARRDLASWHHCVGAVFVSVDRAGLVDIRHLRWDGQRFLDLDLEYAPDGVYYGPRAEALVLGDIHVGWEEPRIRTATFGAEGRIARVRPRRLVLHDVGDGASVNPHSRGPERRLARERFPTVLSELEAIAAWLREAAEIARSHGTEEVIVVESNHDEFFTRWAASPSNEVAPQDLLTYHRLAALVHSGDKRAPLELALELVGGVEGVRFLRVDESYMVCDVELGDHGHRGANGARGNGRSRPQTGRKSVTGHEHAPGVYGGSTVVGVYGSLDMGYNLGLTGWAHADAIVHANRKRQLWCHPA